ncbi:hypothetical protein [Paraflavitalea pollutisoli]|uniref:hypothetical protein n=1 Tax=Paraflavitalea pollutisoli TaxID=3034143 RepID=UPI0023ECE7A6|nr:hypothetical protein [Paraflavitalea sp. H1-2-19X]
MQLNFTFDTVMDSLGPNLTLLGSKDDFRQLAQVVTDLTDAGRPHHFELNNLPFVDPTPGARVVFASKPNANKLGIIEGRVLLFELDARYWERLFKFFVFMSWDRRTYHLNSDDASLADLELHQQCHFICSSEYPHLSKALQE